MSNFNLAVVEGTLNSSPVKSRRKDKDGKYVLFDIITNRIYKKQNKSQFNDNLVPIRAHGNLGDVCLKYLSKDSHVLITGKICGTSISASEVKFLPV